MAHFIDFFVLFTEGSVPAIYFWEGFYIIYYNYCFRLKWVEDSDIGIGIEHFIEVILSVDQFQFEELQLMPSFFELLLSLL